MRLLVSPVLLPRADADAEGDPMPAAPPPLRWPAPAPPPLPTPPYSAAHWGVRCLPVLVPAHVGVGRCAVPAAGRSVLA